MLALARFLILGFVVLGVIYGSLWFALRARRRDKLQILWETRHADRPREEFVRQGLEHHDRLRHRFLVVTVFVLPVCVVLGIIYTTNFQ